MAAPLSEGPAVLLAEESVWSAGPCYIGHLRHRLLAAARAPGMMHTSLMTIGRGIPPMIRRIQEAKDVLRPSRPVGALPKEKATSDAMAPRARRAVARARLESRRGRALESTSQRPSPQGPLFSPTGPGALMMMDFHLEVRMLPYPPQANTYSIRSAQRQDHSSQHVPADLIVRPATSLLPDERVKALPVDMDEMQSTSTAIQGMAERIPEGAARTAARILHASQWSCAECGHSYNGDSQHRTRLPVPLHTGSDARADSFRAQSRGKGRQPLELELLPWHRRGRCHADPPGESHPPIKG